MANYLVTDTQLTSVADAIRAKSGSSAGLAFPSGFISEIGSISSGSGGSSDGDVIFIDYDGTVVTAKTKAEINAMTSDSDLPANPTHTGLTSQGWNWTVAQLKTQLTAMPNQKVYVGQMYVTQSGKTEIDVEMQEGRLSPIMTIVVKGTISVDWGDNTTPDTVTGTNESIQIKVGPHNYTSAGSYTITISVTSGSFSFYGVSNCTLLRKNTTENENKVYSNCVKAIRIGAGITSIKESAFKNCYSLSSITIPSGVTSIGASAFTNCYSLASITIPSGVTSIGNSAFYYCSSLSSITIPSGVTSIENNAFYGCYSLSSITIPSDITIIGSGAFYYCYSLSSIAIPSGVTSIGSNAFSTCYSLASVTIPSGVTSISSTAFSSCYGVKEYHILPTTVPTAGTTIFKNLPSDCVIYVPYSEDHSILESYKTASNWSTYASYMQEEPST